MQGCRPAGSRQDPLSPSVQPQPGVLPGSPLDARLVHFSSWFSKGATGACQTLVPKRWGAKRSTPGWAVLGGGWGSRLPGTPKPHADRLLPPQTFLFPISPRKMANLLPRERLTAQSAACQRGERLRLSPRGESAAPARVRAAGPETRLTGRGAKSLTQTRIVCAPARTCGPAPWGGVCGAQRLPWLRGAG